MEPHQHSSDRLGRIEDKLDTVTEALTQLVRIEERQIQQREDLRRVEAGMASIEKKSGEAMGKAKEIDDKLSTWVNRGIGLWGGAMAIWAVLNSKFFIEILTK